MPHIKKNGNGVVTTNYPRATTDWLSCTFKLTDNPETLRDFFSDLRVLLNVENKIIKDLGYGKHGFKRLYEFEDTAIMFAIGGQHGKAWLSIPGSACSRIRIEQWPNLVYFLRDFLEAKITRWDGAADDYEGEHSVDYAVDEYKRGNFSSGGNYPACKQAGDWIGDGSKGRTFYVGESKNGKLMRIYEKGKQLGDPTSLWVRWEVQLLAKDRVIPWDVVLNPGPYVAGAYKATEWISNESCRIKTYKNTEKISYEVMLRHGKNAVGKLINVMMEKEGSAEAVVEKLRRPGRPARLTIPEPPELYEDTKIDHDRQDRGE